MIDSLIRLFGSKNFIINLTIFFGILLFGGSGFVWWRFVHSDPENVFNAVIDNTLSSGGLTRSLTQSDGIQTISQTTRLQLGEQAVVTGKTVARQSGDVTADVVTENMGTPYADFVRYTEIATSQKTAEGKDLNFSEIINRWGKSEAPEGKTSGESFNEAVLGLFLSGNLTPGERRELRSKSAMDQVYKVDYIALERKTVNGRPQYTYPVTISPRDYVAYLKEFARLTGLNHLDQVDPDAYANSEPIKITVTVDVWSRQLVTVAYDGSERKESISGYGVRTPVSVPEETIKLEELQTKLQNIQ